MTQVAKTNYKWILSFGSHPKSVASTAYQVQPSANGTPQGDYTIEQCTMLNRIKHGVPAPEFSDDPVTAQQQLREYESLIKTKFNEQQLSA